MMTEEIFKQNMADILYREDLPDLDTPLDEIEEWDSVAYVAFVAMASENIESYDSTKKITAADVRHAETLRDLFNLVNRS